MEISKKTNLSSTALRWVQWVSDNNKYRRGERPGDRDLGVCIYQFRRSAKYLYRCTRRKMTYSTYLKWLATGSKGKYYNRNIRGVY